MMSDDAGVLYVCRGWSGGVVVSFWVVNEKLIQLKQEQASWQAHTHTQLVSGPCLAVGQLPR